jgi:hypothetical protein
MDPTFYCITNSVITKQHPTAFVSTVNNGQHIYTVPAGPVPAKPVSVQSLKYIESGPIQ